MTFPPDDELPGVVGSELLLGVVDDVLPGELVDDESCGANAGSIGGFGNDAESTARPDPPPEPHAA